jgi:CheY-like chemotaxis protein
MSGIAIYEEDEMMRALIEEWLRGAGYRVRGAAPLGAPVPGSTDLVIASVYMPKQGGAQLIQELRAAYPRTPLIALSGQFRCGLSSAGAAAQSLGVEQVIAKPLTREALLGSIHAMIGPPT